ncbi:MAG: aminopeptidase, partial [Leptospiraceae bacterium]|nr:aminopeptidase [Leptospiraceae bacterium]
MNSPFLLYKPVLLFTLAAKYMPIKKKYIFLFFSFLLLLSLNRCISYLFHLGKEQARILHSRVPIAEILQKQDLDEKKKKGLELSQKARQFAVKRLGLNSEGGFLYYVELDREEIGWHVTASYPLEFKSYTWWFPIVGSVPYKGYFFKELAETEEAELKKKGLDTRLRITAGYSTLGWFSDPVFSSQLRASEDEIIALVFHEMAHATVYFDGDARFNESYASFVEEEGTRLYYVEESSEESAKILLERQKKQKERDRLIKLLQEYALKLDATYKTDLSNLEKEKNKKR